MPIALAIGVPIGIILLWAVSYGMVLNSQNQAQANTNWFGHVWGNVLGLFAYTVDKAVSMAKYIAHFMYPALKFAEAKVATWLAAHGTVIEWQGNHAHRTSSAVYNVAHWADKDLRREIIEAAHEGSRAAINSNAFTKAPPVPQRRLTQKEVDAEFKKLIDSQFAGKLKQDFPKFDWEPERWLKWLGIAPALGGLVVHPHPTHPQPVPKAVPIAPPQPTTLPHTDDSPNPDPGTKLVPSVVSGKDKWARGQIVKLQKKQNSILSHLGPLAFFAITIPALTTLIGLLECKNFGRFARGICAIPQNLFNDLLGLLLDVLVLSNWCTVLPAVSAAFTEVEGPLTTLIDDAGDALCKGAYKAPPKMNLPTLNVWKPEQIAA